MKRKQEVFRGLSPGRSRGRSSSPSGSGLLRQRRASHAPPPDVYISRSGSLDGGTGSERVGVRRRHPHFLVDNERAR
nr:uncharacterized protein LOC104095984 [Ipomoea batatas]